MAPRVPRLALLWLSVLVPSQVVHAWETDQLTRRAEPLADASAPANAHMDAILDEAARRTNAALRCRADDRRTHRVLARHVRRLTSKTQAVKGRGLVRSLGYGRYAAWLETADLPRREFLDRSDVFGGIPFGRAPILAAGGTSSTVRLGGVLMGTDKPDHFLELGWRYWRRSGRGAHPERAVRWGTFTENTYYGRRTSSGFSYADLHANWQGYLFYDALLHPDDGHFARDEAGCVARVRSFDWHDHVDWRWDEVANPTVYTRRVQRWLDDRLPTRRDDLCAGAGAWLPEVAPQVAVALGERDGLVWAGARSPERVDTFRLLDLCGPAPEAAPPAAVDEALAAP